MKTMHTIPDRISSRYGWGRRHMTPRLVSLFILGSVLHSMALTENTRVARVLNGSTLETTRGDVICIVGEDETNTPYPIRCKEPQATRLAERLLADEKIVIAHCGRDTKGRVLATVLVAGKRYARILHKLGLGEREHDVQVDLAASDYIPVPRSWLRKVPKREEKAVSAPQRPGSDPVQPASLDDRMHAMRVADLKSRASFVESQKVPGSSSYAREMNRYIDGAVDEARGVVELMDKPLADVTARDMHKLADSYGRVKKLESSAAALDARYGNAR